LEEVLEKYVRAGEIAAEVRDRVAEVVDEGVKLIEICEWVEGNIRKLGGEPAFPCNVSVDEVAAHYTSPPGDESTIPPGAVVKVDIGVHVDGYIADTATTICLDPGKERLVEAAREALNAALRALRPNVRISTVSSAIEKAIRARGFKPISNLTGHSLARYTIHAGTTIPNVSFHGLRRLRPGGAYAIEPFVTEGWAAGVVVEGGRATIFRLLKPTAKGKKPSRLVKTIYEKFRTLPFAERWLWRLVPRRKYEVVWRRLLEEGVVMGYPVFVEKSGGPVAQFEHTVLVLEDRCVITTLSEGRAPP